MNLLSSFLAIGKTPSPETTQIDEAYFDRMAAVEFANHDDGLNMHRLKDAQILLVGVSRTEDADSNVFGQPGYRVANYALAPNVDFPLFA